MLDLPVVGITTAAVIIFAAGSVIGHRIGNRRKEQEYERALRNRQGRQPQLSSHSAPDIPQAPTGEPTTDPAHTPRRILILGCIIDSRSFDSFPWHGVPPTLNVADYDIAIINLAPLASSEYARSLDLDGLPKPEQFGRLIFSHNTETVFLGDPTFTLGDPRSGYRKAQSFLPQSLKVVHEVSQVISEVDPGWHFYFTHVSRISFYFDPRYSNHLERYITTYMNAIDPRADSVMLSVNRLAETRSGKPIALMMHYEATSIGRYGEPGEPEEPLDPPRLSSPVYWLPSVTDIDVAEAVALILQSRFGIEMLPDTSPDWISEYHLPNQLSILDQISLADERLSETQSELQDLHAALAVESRPLQLLYETGAEILEPLVLDTLRMLGAKVIEPSKRGIEDGRLVDPCGRHLMLEIKGRTGTLRLNDLRQLRGWVDSAIAEESWEGSGLLIANTHRYIPPDRRPAMYPNSQFLVTAERFGLCLLSTVDLFHALSRHHREELDTDTFWRSLSETNGLWSGFPE